MGHSGPWALRKHPQLKRRYRGSPHPPWEAPGGQGHLSLAVHLPVALRSLLMLRWKHGFLGTCQGAWLTARSEVHWGPCPITDLCS